MARLQASTRIGVRYLDHAAAAADEDVVRAASGQPGEDPWSVTACGSTSQDLELVPLDVQREQIEAHAVRQAAYVWRSGSFAEAGS